MSSASVNLAKKILVRNILFNLLGLSLPLIIGFFSMPLIISGLGKEKFGILSLAWVVLGYAGLFDLGLGRATTKYIASAVSQGQKGQVPSIFWTTVIIQLGFGLVGTMVLYLLSPFLVEKIFRIPVWLHTEAKNSFYFLALVVPLLLIFSSFSGLLEVWQRFDLINAVKIPITSLNFLLAACAYFFPLSLAEIILAMVLFRFVGTLFLFFFCCRQVPELSKKIDFRFELFPRLISFGGWVTISNLSGPFLVYFERFLIGALLSMEAVSYYTAPYEFITRLWILPTSLVLTLFPVFSSWNEGKREEMSGLFFQAVKFLFLLMGPIVLFLSLLAQEILSLWLGKEFMAASSEVFQILAWGVLINSLAHLPMTLLQGMGRPDLPAKFHLIELPIYALLAWFLVRQVGIKGAALAWTLRVAIDALLLFAASLARIPTLFIDFNAKRGKELLTGFLLLTVVTYLIRSFIKTNGINFIFLWIVVSSILFFFFWSWRWWLLPSEKNFIRQLFRR